MSKILLDMFTLKLLQTQSPKKSVLLNMFLVMGSVVAGLSIRTELNSERNNKAKKILTFNIAILNPYTIKPKYHVQSLN